MRCPCNSGDVYQACCGRFLDGDANAPTAVALMRSRYTAFVVGNADYLLSTWHPDTRPKQLELDPEQTWLGLVITDSFDGGPWDKVGVVVFTAHYRHNGARGSMTETSKFIRLRKQWLYVAAGSVG